MLEIWIVWKHDFDIRDSFCLDVWKYICVYNLVDVEEWIRVSYFEEYRQDLCDNNSFTNL